MATEPVFIDAVGKVHVSCYQIKLAEIEGRMHVQFGHLFAKGDTREAAIRAMVVALKEVKIRGEIRSVVDYAVEMIQSPDFVGNNIHTGWLDARIASHVSIQQPIFLILDKKDACA